MPSTAELQAATFKRGANVRLVDDVSGYPAGSQGKVAVANGMTWKRYWVRFPDGNAIGHVDHTSLVSAKDYDVFVVAREREAEEAAKAAEAAVNAPAESAGGGAAAGGGAGVEVNGVFIAQTWLDKSARGHRRIAAGLTPPQRVRGSIRFPEEKAALPSSIPVMSKPVVSSDGPIGSACLVPRSFAAQIDRSDA